ncbi:MAG: flavin reductase protein [Solirubrobacterales bacterium]|jgi:flavin reductase (DIM6/NTAB) family NADH-FMN oxidoreductase RutF|nr:flavin reductase protein [Solirubrobacterales bacterium]
MEFIGEESYDANYSAMSLDGSAFYLYPSRLTAAPPPPQAPSVRSVSDGFRETMRALASGVVLITTHVGGRPWGVTVTSCVSLSVDPPRLLVSLMRETATCKAIEEDRTFGVDLLGNDHKRVAEFGAARGAPKFLDDQMIAGLQTPTRMPMIKGSLSHVDCELEQVFDGGDHAIIVGRVVDVVSAHPHASASPLLYFDGDYHHLGGPL